MSFYIFYFQFYLANVVISDAYRIGNHRVSCNFGGNRRNRAILASFCDEYDEEQIMANIRNLIGSKVGISRDYPLEIREAIRELVSILKLIREGHS
jgi:hypothetical protein